MISERFGTPVRVNLIAAGFVDTPLSATLLGDQLDARREQLRKTLPVRRVVGPADIAAAVREAGGPELDRRRIEVRDPIKTIGTHQVRVRLHPEVSAPVDIEITAS